MSEMYCDEYMEHLQTKLWEMQRGNILCDTHVQVLKTPGSAEKVTVNFHKCVTACNSEFFRTKYRTDTQLLTEKESSLDELSEDSFASFLRFFYTGTLQLCDATLPIVLKMSDFFISESLLEALFHMLKHKSLTLLRLIPVFEATIAPSFATLTSQIKYAICTNMEALLQLYPEQLLTMSLDNLLALLSDRNCALNEQDFAFLVLSYLARNKADIYAQQVAALLERVAERGVPEAEFKRAAERIPDALTIPPVKRMLEAYPPPPEEAKKAARFEYFVLLPCAESNAVLALDLECKTVAPLSSESRAGLRIVHEQLQARPAPNEWTLSLSFEEGELCGLFTRPPTDNRLSNFLVRANQEWFLDYHAANRLSSFIQVKGQLFHVGGSRDGRVLRNTALYGDGPWREICAMASPRCEHALVFSHDLVFALGGQTEAAVLGACECLPVREAKYEWRSLPPMQRPRTGHRGVAVGERVYVVGGFSDRARSKPVPQAEAFDLRAGRWADVAACPAATLPCHALAAVGMGFVAFFLKAAEPERYHYQAFHYQVLPDSWTQLCEFQSESPLERAFPVSSCQIDLLTPLNVCFSPTPKA